MIYIQTDKGHVEFVWYIGLAALAPIKRTRLHVGMFREAYFDLC